MGGKYVVSKSKYEFNLLHVNAGRGKMDLEKVSTHLSAFIEIVNFKNLLIVLSKPYEFAYLT